jgi:hypothetical protein
MKSPRLGLLALAGIGCWLFLSGCLSAEVETRVSRNLSVVRSYRLRLDPVPARLYRTSPAMFSLPGQDLDKLPGVEVVEKREVQERQGGLELLWSYRASRAENFSSGNDSLRLSRRRSGWWLNYNYYERILPRSDTASLAEHGGGSFRALLVMPGQMRDCNGDSTDGSRVVWQRTMESAATEGLVMSAQSREIDPLFLLFLALAGGGLMLLGISRRRPAASEADRYEAL